MTDSFHMTPEDFRRWGHAVVDWVARYLAEVEHHPVQSRDRPGDVRARLPEAPPERGEPFDRILADLDRVVLPGITHWQSPGWFGYFPANGSGPAILGELVSAGLGVQGMLWSTSPACTELETHVLDWMAALLDLPRGFRSDGRGGGVIQDSASSAVLAALVAARERASRGETERLGADRRQVVYASAEAHSSVDKAVRVAGLGSEHLRRVPVDARRALRPDALDAAIREDLAAGRVPTFAVATVGTTSTHAMDPLGPIGEVCRRHGVWLHVDGAMAGVAAICPEHRHLLDGLALADSFCTNPHKWLFTNFDCSCFWVADRAALVSALGILPEYLRNRATESGAVVDYRDWQIPLGRRFRALKLWFVLRHYGAEGLRHHLRRHVALARAFAERVAADPRFALLEPPPLSLVCFRLRAGDAATQAALDRVNASGEVFLTHTRVDGHLTLRLSVGQTHTEARHVDRAFALLAEAADAGAPPGGG